MTIAEPADAPGRFVLGLDLDGTCADFYGRMREIAAEWTGRPVAALTADPDWGLTSWGLLEGEYERLHRFAVTQRDLFVSMRPIVGAPQALRRLGTEGIHIRIITHRLFIRHFHETAVAQTVRWLDNHGIPYWDLCFMRRKGDVGADLTSRTRRSTSRTCAPAARRCSCCPTPPTNTLPMGTAAERRTGTRPSR